MAPRMANASRAALHGNAHGRAHHEHAEHHEELVHHPALLLHVCPAMHGPPRAGASHPSVCPPAPLPLLLMHGMHAVCHQHPCGILALGLCSLAPQSSHARHAQCCADMAGVCILLRGGAHVSDL